MAIKVKRQAALGSMRARLTLWLALVFAFFMIFLSAGYLLYARGQTEQDFAASLDQIAPESARLARRGATLDELRAAIEAHNARVSQSGAISEGVEAWLLDPQKRLVWRVGPPRPLHHVDEKHDGAHQDEEHQGVSTRIIPPLADPSGWRTRQVKWRGQRLLLGLPLRRARGELRGQALALGTLSLLVTGAAALGAWALVGKTLAPIGALAQQARQTAASPVRVLELRAPLRPTSLDREMTDLVSTLNAMLDNVREAALSKERFHTSASHELRTPLQALSGHLGVALSRERDAAQYRSALEEAARQTARLNKLTGDLLLLNRLQTAASAPSKERVDVAEVCDIALQRAQRTIEARSLKVAGQLESLWVQAAPSHVEILLGNLVENAAKYARQGGRIGIEIEVAACALRVWNEGDATQWAALENQLPRLFEPFYRPDVARARDTGGNGLGLAICQTIAEVNRWTLTIQSDAGRFEVRVGF